MPVPLDTLESKLLKLPEDTRERLANVLMDSLPGSVETEFSQEQLAEFALRSAEISAGRADLVSYDEVLREVENALLHA